MRRIVNLKQTANNSSYEYITGTEFSDHFQNVTL